ncbi:DNA (cytosine-5-)-methyltransferase [Undibacterium sp. TS12]|uniref:DNA cytosine methyltransferase n=1 Tax=Undibacterium sp. TS12 TaxID=2908202 RepID=UPI001F4C9B4B|nr:DNA (cytosine-5-)-methyltransferase [Undibacterium sp. TS12]MCH8618159.1 DNA (cytosine-5-)-methyltransferase [Undibacterium sp. TS12]
MGLLLGPIFFENKNLKMKNAKKNRQLVGIDLFAGAGGFSLAAANVGIKIKAAVEMNQQACSTYTRNLIKKKHNPAKLFPCDINEIKLKDFLKAADLKKEECDVLMGGPPCQGFSTHRINDEGVDDPRNSLLLRYFEFVRHLKPKFFVVENVPGLLWKRHEKYLNKFLIEARKSKYTVYGPTVLNAQDFGVPQNRKRVFIIGVRNDLKLNFDWPPKPTHFSPTSKEAVTGSPLWVCT